MTSAKPPNGVHLPRHVTWEQVRSDVSIPIAFTNTRRMAKSLAAKGTVAIVVAGISEDELADLLRRAGTLPIKQHTENMKTHRWRGGLGGASDETEDL